ncbi:MAG: hypothetical protein VKO44_06055 [Cyanobacteriota bacterium]|nr:hypothetical protein [Cyanobacteriota bacterium]
MRSLLVLGGIAATTLATLPAHAYFTQTFGPLNFSTSGTTITTAPLVFPPFSAAPPGQLDAVKLVFQNASFSQNASLAKLSGAARTFTASAMPSFVFGNGSTPGMTSSAITLTPNVVSGPGVQGVISTVSGAYLGSVSTVSTNSAPLQSYFSTAGVAVTSYSTAYNFMSSPVGGLGTADLDPADGTSAVFSGKVFIEYQYVPGPLPLLGAGAAFGWSRRLRKRIKNA